MTQNVLVSELISLLSTQTDIAILYVPTKRTFYSTKYFIELIPALKDRQQW
jgi:hypothetical protein